MSKVSRRPQEFTTSMEQTDRGPVVVINGGRYGCQVEALVADGPRW